MDENISKNERNAYQKRRLQYVIENTIRLESYFQHYMFKLKHHHYDQQINTENA